MSHDIEITQDGAVLVLRLTRPSKRNALTREMYRLLAEALRSSDTNSEIAVRVILGSGGHFTAGNDISDFLQAATGEAALPTEVVDFIEQLAATEKPLLAAVDGHAVGIGTTLLLHCDLVYATPRALFSTPFLDLGLVPEAASSLLMPERLGPQRAFEMLVLGETFTAERAHCSGLINAIFAEDVIEEQVLSAARRLGDKPPAALAAARRLIRGDPLRVVSRMREEARLFAERLASPEARHAFESFLSRNTVRSSRDPGS